MERVTIFELCLDEKNNVWVMLYSGSRGVGNVIGNLFTSLVQKDMQVHIANLHDRNFAYFEEESKHFNMHRHMRVFPSTQFKAVFPFVKVKAKLLCRPVPQGQLLVLYCQGHYLFVTEYNTGCREAKRYR